MHYQKFSLLYGFSIWLIATLLFSFAGHHFFLTENQLVMTSFYIGVIPLLYLMVIPVLKKFKLSRDERVLAAVLMALPGIMLDVLCIRYHKHIFPTLSTEEAIVLGSWVLWVYAVVLLLGLWHHHQNRPTEHLNLNK